MHKRRDFITAMGASALAWPLSVRAESQAAGHKRLAVVTTEWRFHSHAWHMAERFLVGYPINGRWHRPPLDVVAAYVDQKPESDLSAKRSKEFGFPIYPTPAQIREWVKDPVAYRYEYADGVKATMLLMNGLIGDFTFAARLKGEPEPLSTLFYLPPTPNVTYSASLMSKAEETFLTGKSPYPVERTLLTTGLVEAGVRSLGTGQKRLETPHLAIHYEAPRESTFARS